MNKGFAKILVAVDGSQPSINAAERAISLAKKYGANASGTVTTSRRYILMVTIMA